MARSKSKAEFWRSRLRLPAYRVEDAARYAQVQSATVGRWHSITTSDGKRALSKKQPREALSYLQLIELAVVAQIRARGVPLSRIRAAREYLSSQLQTEFPFAHYRFKTDGKELLVDYQEIDDKGPADTLVTASKNGQLAWTKILQQRLDQFEYERGGIVQRWYVMGRNRPIVIDPQIAFGAPSVGNIPTWAIREHWDANESIPDIVDDLGIPTDLVECALEFEGIKPDHSRPNLWAN